MKSAGVLLFAFWLAGCASQESACFRDRAVYTKAQKVIDDGRGNRVHCDMGPIVSCTTANKRAAKAKADYFKRGCPAERFEVPACYENDCD